MGSSSSAIRDAIAGMIAMAVAMGIGRFVFTPILPGMMSELGLSASDAGLIASANYVGYLLGAIVAAGNWGQGRERAIAFVSLAASAVLCAAMAMTSDVTLFLVVRFLAGVASAVVMIFTTTIVAARLAAAGRSSLQAWHFGGVGLGIAVSSVMMLLLQQAAAAWQAGWIWSAVLSALGLVAVLSLLRPGISISAQGKAEPPMPRSAPLYRIILAYGLFGFGYVVTATFLVAIVRAGEAGRSFEAIVWLVTGLAGIPSVWLWARVTRRIGTAAAFAAACGVEAVGVLASVVLGGIVGPVLSGLLLGGTFIAITAIGLQIGRQLGGEAPRRVLAVMTAAFGVGQIIGPVVAGFVADLTGSFFLPSLLAAAILAVSAAIVGLPARTRTDAVR